MPKPLDSKSFATFETLRRSRQTPAFRALDRGRVECLVALAKTGADLRHALWTCITLYKYYGDKTSIWWTLTKIQPRVCTTQATFRFCSLECALCHKGNGTKLLK